mmetsp:Transcript_15286/g.41093  ORF Transcript_15286/g.41093 Transcript_15286/m.41093 type:complete len:240 (-) Transcript_15286:1455-2174(-)
MCETPIRTSLWWLAAASMRRATCAMRGPFSAENAQTPFEVTLHSSPRCAQCGIGVCTPSTGTATLRGRRRVWPTARPFSHASRTTTRRRSSRQSKHFQAIQAHRKTPRLGKTYSARRHRCRKKARKRATPNSSTSKSCGTLRTRRRARRMSACTRILPPACAFSRASLTSSAGSAAEAAVATVLSHTKTSQPSAAQASFSSLLLCFINSEQKHKMMLKAKSPPCCFGAAGKTRFSLCAR